MDGQRDRHRSPSVALVPRLGVKRNPRALPLVLRQQETPVQNWSRYTYPNQRTSYYIRPSSNWREGRGRGDAGLWLCRTHTNPEKIMDSSGRNAIRQKPGFACPTFSLCMADRWEEREVFEFRNSSKKEVLEGREQQKKEKQNVLNKCHICRKGHLIERFQNSNFQKTFM